MVTWLDSLVAQQLIGFYLSGGGAKLWPIECQCVNVYVWRRKQWSPCHFQYYSHDHIQCDTLYSFICPILFVWQCIARYIVDIYPNICYTLYSAGPFIWEIKSFYYNVIVSTMTSQWQAHHNLCIMWLCHVRDMSD